MSVLGLYYMWMTDEKKNCRRNVFVLKGKREMSKTKMMVDNGVRLIDAKTLAEILSVSPRTVWRLRAAGKLPQAVTFGGSVRWRLSDIALWQELRCPSTREFNSRKGDRSHV